MLGSLSDRPAQECQDFDYSTPESQQALEQVTSLILEIREEHNGPMARRVALYERTLGLAVIPVLIRRAIIVLSRKVRKQREELKSGSA